MTGSRQGNRFLRDQMPTEPLSIAAIAASVDAIGIAATAARTGLVREVVIECSLIADREMRKAMLEDIHSSLSDEITKTIKGALVQLVEKFERVDTANPKDLADAIATLASVAGHGKASNGFRLPALLTVPVDDAAAK